MSFCTNRARVCILSSGVFDEAVSDDVVCLISAEASRRPLVRLTYQLPICCQLENPFDAGPPAGKKDTTICPSTPSRGGMSASLRMPFTSLTLHCHWLFPLGAAFTSG